MSKSAELLILEIQLDCCVDLLNYAASSLETRPTLESNQTVSKVYRDWLHKSALQTSPAKVAMAGIYSFLHNEEPNVCGDFDHSSASHIHNIEN
ncbi:hypothetical protein ElyMa_002384600 [Elysia marginata]|uniref:Uncharacterized protein n=1 Tax=Elysia marginata TaxID=1093978 RepID=A0AAV4GDD0_9GAST|nr:hypothetical protein ElyMa_002384600 [Elysia marginata]